MSDMARQAALNPRSTLATRHWLAARLSAVPLLPLSLWLAIHLAALPGLSYEVIVHWLREPLHAIPLAVYLLLATYHARLGLQGVLDDYVHHSLIKCLGRGAVNLTLLTVLLAGLGSLVLLNRSA